MRAALTCIINVRNGERYLRETLESVRGQLEPVECLVIDNQSTDRTPEIAQSFSSVACHRTPQSLSLGAARNFGLSLATTDFVAWLDADDLWESQFSRDCVSVLRSHPETVMVSTGCSLIDEQGKPARDMRRPWRETVGPEGPIALTEGDSPASLVERGASRSAWCAYVFRTSTVRAINGFDGRFQFSEDLDLIARLLEHGKALHIRKNLSRYRIHPSQYTQTLDPSLRYQESHDVLSSVARRFNLMSESQLRSLERVLRFKAEAYRLRASPSLHQAVNTAKLLMDREILGWIGRYGLRKLGRL